MHVATSRRLRRLLTTIAGTAWVAAAAIVGVAVVRGTNYALHLGLLFCLSVAITATITVLVGGVTAPVEATFRHVYNAGLADGIRQGRPVIVPESRMVDKRGRAS